MRCCVRSQRSPFEITNQTIDYVAELAELVGKRSAVSFRPIRHCDAAIGLEQSMERLLELHTKPGKPVYIRPSGLRLH